MDASLQPLSFLTEVGDKNKMMVVRVSLDVYNLLQREAEESGVTVSALVRSLFAFHYYPDLAALDLRRDHDAVAESVSAEHLDGGLGEYEGRLAQLAANLELVGQLVAREQARVGRARAEILRILHELARASDEIGESGSDARDPGRLAPLAGAEPTE